MSSVSPFAYLLLHALHLENFMGFVLIVTLYQESEFYSLLLFSCWVVSNSLQPHGLQHSRLPCSWLSPRVYSNSCPLSRWGHQTISSSVTPFSSCPQSFPDTGSFPMSWLFTSGTQSVGTSASASVLPMNVQGWFPLVLTGLISLQSRGLWRVFPLVPLFFKLSSIGFLLWVTEVIKLANFLPPFLSTPLTPAADFKQYSFISPESC